MNNNQPKKKSAKRTVLTVIAIVLALVLILGTVFTMYVEHLLNKLGRYDPNNDVTLSQEEIDAIQNATDEGYDPSAGTDDGSDIKWDENHGIQIGGGKEIVNILLIGQDRRPGESRARSDSMILCTFNKKDNTLTMTSFLRDLYIKIPGYKDNRINAAYAFGGMKLLNKTLDVNFGIKVDGNVEVDFTQFSKIVDLLGGVDIELSSGEAKIVGGGAQAGKNHLNGEQALEYARIRKINSTSGEPGDLGRANRQRTVLNALIEKYKNSSLTTMLSTLNDILPMVTTDLSNKELIAYATDFFPMLANCKIVTQRIPADNAYQMRSIRGMSVLVPNMEANRKLLVDTLSPSK